MDNSKNVGKTLLCHKIVGKKITFHLYQVRLLGTCFIISKDVKILYLYEHRLSQVA